MGRLCRGLRGERPAEEILEQLQFFSPVPLAVGSGPRFSATVDRWKLLTGTSGNLVQDRVYPGTVARIPAHVAPHDVPVPVDNKHGGCSVAIA